MSETQALPSQRLVNWWWRQPVFAQVLGYLLSILFVGLVAWLSLYFHRLKPANTLMLYLGAVVLAALFLGRGPAVLASILGVLAFDFLKIEPRLSFQVADPEDLLTFLGLFLVGLVVSTFSARLRDQVAALRSRQAYLNALNSLSRDLSRAISLDEMFSSLVTHIQNLFGFSSAILLPDGGALRLAAASFGLDLSPLDWQAAMLTYEQSSRAGAGSIFVPDAALSSMPLEGSNGIVGVLCIQAAQIQGYLSPDQRTFLDGFVSLAALAIERADLAEKANQAKILENTERLQTALLHSISHELRTPLVSITGTLSSLLEDYQQEKTTGPNQAARFELVDTAYGEAQRLNLIVGNLLDMIRFEAGAAHLALEPCDVQDLIGIALARFSERSSVRVSLENDLPLLHLDVALMVQVLLNLLDNAAKFSPESASIEISACQQSGEVILSVADSGIGIPKEDLDKVFGRFYRSAPSKGVSGIGLGLSICKSIVDAHGGRIWASRRKPVGSLISVALPLSGQPQNGTESG